MSMRYIEDKSILTEVISKDKDVYAVKDSIRCIIDGLKMRIIDERSQEVVIGTLIACEEQQYKIKSINPNILVGERARSILKFMNMVIANGDKLTIETLTEEMKSKNALDYIGGITYITHIVAITITNSDFDYHLNKLNENYLRREFLNEIKSLTESIIDNESLITIANKLDDLRKELNNSNDITSKYVDFSDIDITEDKIYTIQTGIKKLDAILSDEENGGIEYGTLSVLTGMPSSGKSTILNQIVAECMLQGEKAFIYSGELPHKRLKKWFNRTVSNKEHLKDEYDSNGKKIYKTTSLGNNLISKWSRNKLFIYGENSKANESNILGTIEHLHINKGVRLFVLDNLMSMYSDTNDEKYAYQERIVKDLSELAKKYGLIIILVAHPKKEYTFANRPTMYDVSGAAEIVNYADYVMMTLRIKNNEEFKSGIIILKNRINGKQGITVKLDFSEERKRFYTNELELNKDFKYSS